MRYYSPKILANGKHATEEYKRSVVKYHLEKKWGPVHTAKYFGLSTTTVRNWIAIFADENPISQPLVMKTTDASPKSINLEELNALPPEEQIARLKEALHRAELKADLYDEMINVAEAKFKVSIRKKAGAKR